MKRVDWLDFPAVCLEMVDEVEATGELVDICKDGTPVVRLMPVDAETLAAFEAGEVREMDLSVSRGQG